MSKLRMATVSVLSAAVLIGPAAMTPAQATHACDPELSVLCAHPQDLTRFLDLLCDKSQLVDKIMERFTSCGTS
jgi:hypothetical protein